MKPSPFRSTDRPPHNRRVFCNRTVDMAEIQAIGYDMDYTLVHYDVNAFEEHAYEHVKRRLVDLGWPVGDLKFDPDLVTRGLIIDNELGNVVKANRFGFVKAAAHGVTPLPYREMKRIYARTVIEDGNPRFSLLTTLFSISEACLYAQVVALYDRGRITATSYADIHHRVRSSTDRAHFEGELKPRIQARPDQFIIDDPHTAMALLDQRSAGKRLMLITNSDWLYTDGMMRYAIERHLPRGAHWRDLFELIICSADKPSFFATTRPLYEVADERDALLRVAVEGLRSEKIFWGGHAGLVEKYLGLSGDEILYVGDHIIGDVEISKSVLRWRTALVLREIEEEIDAVDRFAARQEQLDRLMDAKGRKEYVLAQARLREQRAREAGRAGAQEQEAVKRVREEIKAIDREVAPLAKAASKLGNRNWGLLMRSGNEKSFFARKVENSADIYLSRVSNLSWQTPFLLLRSWPGSMPHDI